MDIPHRTVPLRLIDMSRSTALTTRLRGDVLRGFYVPGERLVEAQLTERYKVGRAAVRSALVELGKEGLVMREANRGATVRRIPISEVIQISEARQALETLIAGHAAVNSTDSDRSGLREVADRMREAVDAEEYVVYSDLNSLLHERIIEMSTQQIAGELVANLRNRAAHHQFRLALRPGRPAESLPQHEAIIEAIARGDRRAAEKAMHDHLDSVISTLQHWVELGVEA